MASNRQKPGMLLNNLQHTRPVPTTGNCATPNVHTGKADQLWLITSEVTVSPSGTKGMKVTRQLKKRAGCYCETQRPSPIIQLILYAGIRLDPPMGLGGKGKQYKCGSSGYCYYCNNLSFVFETHKYEWKAKLHKNTCSIPFIFICIWFSNSCKYSKNTKTSDLYWGWREV